MEFENVIRNRYSVRKYKADMISDDDLQKIINAGMIAPTGCNIQPQRIYVVKSSDAVGKMRKLTKCAFDAPVVLIVALKESEDWKSPLEEGCRAGIQDVSIVADHMMLEAWNIGVGSCWVNLFKPSEVKTAFDLPEDETPVLLMTLGYPADESRPAKMHFSSRSSDEIVKYI